MPKVLSSPKLPTGNRGGRRSFRLSPLEIGVAILVAMGGVYLIYVLLSGLFGGGAEAPTPAGGPLGQGINPARLDKVLSAAEAANQRIKDLDKRLAHTEKRLNQAQENGQIPAAGSGNPKLAARVAALEKKLANLPAAPAAGGKAADPKLAARMDKLEKSLAALDKQNKELAKSLGAAQGKLTPQVAQMEKSLAALDKQNQAMAKDLKKLAPAKGEDKLAAKVAELDKRLEAKSAPAPAKLDQRLASLEKQVKDLAQRPPAKGGTAAAAPPELTQRVAGQGKVLAGLTTSLGQLQRGQERLAKQLGVLAVAPPTVKGAPLASPLLAQRLSGLEKQIAALGQAQARPSRQELEAAKRIASLEKELAQVKKQAAAAVKADPKLSARLRSLEKQQAADNKDEQVMDRRLDQLEKKVSTVAAQAKARPALVAKPAPPAEPKPVRIIHLVRPGQTLYGLARSYGVKMRQIKEWNPQLGARDKLYIGEKLVIVVRK
ncbi:MAG: LysM peptidoglycan-binding domain-containing protein [Desulfarculaceae bacterium]|nr:LysM peptidoglycan-binding domain-containing protein [Desulfarculaceae bacterium]MCF8049573.1 LysM peptidoglycan-binding domain-containing protein [Desulfarculaceae bacterium]MCF8122682.1 LysM peptidoglycan-binding domain-containing protein [Desulfarculaceae bacterium]